MLDTAFGILDSDAEQLSVQAPGHHLTEWQSVSRPTAIHRVPIPIPASLPLPVTLVDSRAD